ncbi:methyltransferase dimerization domain-containing protein [Streptomyces inhibens]|uniref:methyltransferase family protein n=1 Tax=Streptomyces inhibens TaxID=2293571 RepID=UPI00379F45B8
MSRENQPSHEARDTLVRIAYGAMTAHTAGAAARLRIVDLIGDGARTADELAAEYAAQPPAMGRLLRALAGIGLLVERSPGAFAVTPAGALLRSDGPDSLHSFVRMFTDPAMLRAWERLDDSVRTGETAFGPADRGRPDRPGTRTAAGPGGCPRAHTAVAAQIGLNRLRGTFDCGPPPPRGSAP